MNYPHSEELETLRAVDDADVFKAGRRAARLKRTGDGVVFSYLPEWVRSGGPAVASTLPVNSDPVASAGGALPAYFTGLLPEGRRLGALRRAVKTSADDELSLLLLAVGADTVGDVQVVPSGSVPADVAAHVALERVDTMRFAELLIELGIHAQRAALPGVQDKASAAMITLPVSRAGQRYILKLNPPEYPHLVENEAFFLGAARASGLTVPRHELVTDADGQIGLLVLRFDRTTVEGVPRMLAVEDGCQAADRPPADKYRLAADDVFSALAAVCDATALAGRDLVRQLAFAYVTGNAKAHAKNFSVLQGLDGEWRVSPVYDLPSCQPYGDITMALRFGCNGGGDFGRDDFLALGARLGVPARAVTRTLADLVGRTHRWLPDLDTLPFDRRRLAMLRRVIQWRSRRIAPTAPAQS